MTTELEGDRREIHEATPADRATAVLVADEQGSPAELGAAPRVLVVESGGVVDESAKLDYPVFDADNNLYEAREALTKFLPDRYRGVIDYVELRGRTKAARPCPKEAIELQD